MRSITLLVLLRNFGKFRYFLNKNPKFKWKRNFQEILLVCPHSTAHLLKKLLLRTFRSQKLPDFRRISESCNWQENVKKRTQRVDDFLSILETGEKNKFVIKRFFHSRSYQGWLPCHTAFHNKARMNVIAKTDCLLVSHEWSKLWSFNEFHFRSTRVTFLDLRAHIFSKIRSCYTLRQR